ncbi:hypothetical protein BHM03_00057722 [Ensete ventricosum]|nr:hypothetical protein BHM03_00057722 [Ensete ventricosum]
MSSDGASHNEFDFEFLGNRTGEPYLVQSNLYINGVGNREQRMDLWFDPTADFHAYSILWNPRQVVFLVDDTPIRVFSNQEHRGIVFPRDQPMGIYSSIWNADDWATEGGRVKTDWSHAPFVATFRGLRIDGCEWASTAEGPAEVQRCSASAWGKEGRYWWKEKEMEALSVHQSHQLIWARANHLVYDYCSDPARCLWQWTVCILTASVPSQFTEPTECDGGHNRLRIAKVKLLDSILKRLEKLVKPRASSAPGKSSAEQSVAISQRM